MIGHYVRDVRTKVSGYAEAVLNETTVRIAVTGLSRSGKTVFLTSLIHNLLAMGRGLDTLPALGERLGAGVAIRMHGVRTYRGGAAAIPRFDYEEKLAELAAGTPAWPASTEDLAQVVLEIMLDRANPLAQWLGRRRLRLELLDYPGEWLLDLPLLSQAYGDWSREILQLLRQPPRRGLCAPFLEFLSSVEPGGGADAGVIGRGHALYRDALLACRGRGLRYLQPGRFLCPGRGGEAASFLFFPLDRAPRRAAPSSLAEMMDRRFEAYKAAIREEFFDTYFVNFDRQVFLVDVLSALHAGKAAFEDTERAIADIARHLRYGSRWVAGPVGRLAKDALRYLPGTEAIRQAKIGRVAFVATKADHVPSLQRENLKNLLRALVETAQSRYERSLNELSKRPVSYHAVAAVRSTKDAKALRDGRPIEVVKGFLLGEEVRRSFDPGDVPSGPPPESFWSDEFFKLPPFAPPALDPSGAVGIPHFGLDELIVWLLRDVL